MVDCLILGFFDYPFPEYVAMVRSMGEHSGAYRDLTLSFVTWNGKPYRALDLLTAFRREERNDAEAPFHNADFLWPVVTYLTTYLRRRGFSAEYINLPHLSAGELASCLRTNSAGAVAITTTLYVSPAPILELVKQCRRIDPRVPIVVGGPFISTLASSVPKSELTSTLRYIGADIYVLCNEGEATLASVLRALRDRAPLAAVPNLAFRQDAGYAFTSNAPEVNPLAENMVEYSMFPKEHIGQYVTTRTAKSCPFSCSFCGFPTRAGPYTYLDGPQVESEFDAIEAIGGVTTVTIIDDTYNVPRTRFKRHTAHDGSEEVHVQVELLLPVRSRR
jgi:hypothetical protein